MLKFLTHKLRTHSLNEDANQEKTDDDHDSGTESDDEFQDGSGIADEPSSPLESLGSPGLPDSAVPSDTDFGVASTPAYSFRQYEAGEESKVEMKAVSQPMPCKARDAQNFLEYLNYNDQHSSEEELEVINGPKVAAAQGRRPATAPEKRKWSEVNNSGGSGETHNPCQAQQQLFNSNDAAPAAVVTCSAPASRTGREGSGSSDEEVQGLLDSRSESVISQPVQFRTSPPLDAHKPGRSLSPPPKLFHASSSEPRPQPRPRSRPRPHTYLHTHLDHHHHHYSSLNHHHHHHQHYVDADVDAINACSPRKRHRPPHRLPRPCLDFEKMQQMKAQAVTTWRHSSEHGKELSVFCW